MLEQTPNPRGTHLERKLTTHTGKREERKDQLKAPGPKCGRVFKPHALFSRFMGRLALIFSPWPSGEYSDRRAIAQQLRVLRKPYCPKGACCKSVGEW
ncbi:hypothetical protein SLEP1_g59599 [Rubroshorea leprosula]|uniref:Uncharacterized protein n=1 Tax=Rubroshorea leprosula TaxID=152421 RepID=A0AAV5MTA2_9ROSI|nr:hypothetical protein SLEP1_g59599 [Rubroshorea leprosula]